MKTTSLDNTIRDREPIGAAAGKRPPPLKLVRGEAEIRKEFLGAMGRRVSSVNLVTTDGGAGKYGLTVTSMCSVSADPPLVMIGINRKSPLCGAITDNRCFAVNVLSVAQQALADTFAGFGPEGAAYDFSLAGWQEGESGAPILDDCTAWLECALDTFVDAGSHRMFMGRVVRAGQGSRPALCYGGRSYRRARKIA